MTAVNTYNPTTDLYINGVLSGNEWAVNSLTFSFPALGSYYGTPYGSSESTTGFKAFTAIQQDAVRSILKQYSTFINFSFTEITETATQHAELRYAESDAPSTAWAYYPMAAAVGGDAWFNNSKAYYDNPVLGTYAYLTLMHETGHAMGLKHPQSAEGAFGAMPVDHDSLEYTVMSYRSYIGASTTGGLTNEGYGYPQSLMMYDIAGLQVEYGANYSTNSGNTVYAWNPVTGQESINGVAQTAPGANRIFQTIWDGGGQDTYDFSNYTTAVKVDLTPGGWTTTSAAQLAYLGGGHYAIGNIANALLYQGNVASLIENAVGGSGSDTLVGNVADNRLTGGGGNDALDGAVGTDTAVYSGLSTDYRLVQNANGSWTVTDLRSGSPDGTDTLTNIEKVQFSNTLLALGTVITVNQPPVVTASDITATANQVLAAASLFTVTDPDTSAMVMYQFVDATSASTSGHFSVGGVTQAANVSISVTAAQLAQTTFVAGSTSDNLYVSVFDGTSWSAWDGLAVTIATVAPVNQPPTVTAPDITATTNQVFAASSLFTVTDPENSAITKYQFLDTTVDASSGHFSIGGVTQAANVAIDVTAAQLAQTSFVAGSTSDTLSVRAFDGTSWSAWDGFTVTVPVVAVNQSPVVTAPDITATSNQVFAAASLFTVTDPDTSAMVMYQFVDATGASTSGHFSVGGVTQAANVSISVTAAQLAQTTFVAGSTSDNLYVSVFDGTSWSAWDGFKVTGTVAPVNQSPTVTAPDITATAAQVLAASSLFTVTDPENNAITKYQFLDTTVDASSGHFSIGGVTQAANVAIDVTAAQLAQTSFVAGSTSDTLSVRAFDGTSWSAWDGFNVNVPIVTVPLVTVNQSPVVTAPDITATSNQVLAAASLFTVTDPDTSAMVMYQFVDATSASTSGHFSVGGVVQTANTSISVTAAQLAQTTFVAGSTSDNLYVSVFDGTSWSAWDGFKVTATSVNHAPTVTVSNISATSNQVLAASSLFTVMDADNDAIVTYQLIDATSTSTSGHFSVGGVVQAANTPISLTAAQLAQTTFIAGSTSDILYISAFDGKAWSPWDSFALSATSVNHAPSVTVSNITAASDQVLAASSLFTVMDADNDAIVTYQLIDTTSVSSSGHFNVGGIAQAANTPINLTAAQLAQTTFVAGSTSDILYISAFDGKAWSAWSGFTVTPTLAAPANQTVVAAPANPLVSAAHSNDSLIGGPSNDHFVFGSNFGKDTIANIQIGGISHDNVDLVHPGHASFAEIIAHAEQVGGNVVINVDADNSLTLVNTTIGAILQQHDHFLFLA